MKLSKADENYFSMYTDILIEELILATGCTEPIAIAYAASIVTHILGNAPQAVRIGLSGSIIKNVKSAVVPTTYGLRGIKAAISAGGIANSPQLGLNVLSTLKEEQLGALKSYMANTDFDMYDVNSKNEFEIDILGICGKETVRVHIVGQHTNIVAVEKNGEDIIESYTENTLLCTKKSTDHSVLNLKKIVEFAKSIDLDKLRSLLKQQIEVNMAIAEEGLRGEYGLQ